jgi:arylsulfatase A
VHNTNPKQYAIRHGDWLLVDGKTGTMGEQPPAAWLEKYGVPPDDGQPVELYNLQRDVGQRENVAAAHPDTVAELQSLLKGIRSGGHTAPRLD